mmetsp:Transcript_7494/g.16260  ORF Transcript_7494/g.16260 Transcript_7494/m.16260 type:complete len:227 (+) Transcript_7494:2890-3570(+)
MTLVLQAEGKCLVCSHGIQGLQLGIRTKDLQHTAVGLPQEPEPGCHQLPVRAILALLLADIAEHNVLRRSILLQILDINSYSCSLGLGLLCFLAGFPEVILDDLLQAVDVNLLTHVSVRHESLLGVVTLLHLHSQVNVLEHDALICLGPSPVLLAGYDVVQGLERSLLLAHILQFVSPFQSIFGPCEARSTPKTGHVIGQAAENLADLDFAGNQYQAGKRHSTAGQ